MEAAEESYVPVDFEVEMAATEDSSSVDFEVEISEEEGKEGSSSSGANLLSSAGVTGIFLFLLEICFCNIILLSFLVFFRASRMMQGERK